MFRSKDSFVHSRNRDPAKAKMSLSHVKRIRRNTVMRLASNNVVV
jgi:hypothetical protein